VNVERSLDSGSNALHLCALHRSERITKVKRGTERLDFAFVRHPISVFGVDAFGKENKREEQRHKRLDSDSLCEPKWSRGDSESKRQPSVPFYLVCRYFSNVVPTSMQNRTMDGRAFTSPLKLDILTLSRSRECSFIRNDDSIDIDRKWSYGRRQNEERTHCTPFCSAERTWEDRQSTLQRSSLIY